MLGIYNITGIADAIITIYNMFITLSFSVALIIIIYTHNKTSLLSLFDSIQLFLISTWRLQ